MDDHTVDAVDDNDADPSFIASAALVPARLFLSTLVTLIRVFRPYAPQLIPLLVCLLLLPAVILVSVFAGFLVWRDIAVPWDAPLHLQFGYVGSPPPKSSITLPRDGQPPYARASLPPLVPHQRYDISVQFVIPAVESNFALGNFMTSLILTTPSNQTLTSVRQPVSLLSAPCTQLQPLPGNCVPSKLVFLSSKTNHYCYHCSNALLVSLKFL